MQTADIKNSFKIPSLVFSSHTSTRNGAPLSLLTLLTASSLPYPVYITFPSAGPVIPYFQQAGFKIITASKNRKKDEFYQYKFLDIWRIKKTLKTIGPNLLIANSIGSWRAVLLAKQLRIKTIFYIHEILNPGDKKTGGNWAKSISSANQVLCVSHASMKSIKTLAPYVNPIVLHPGINVEKFHKKNTEKDLRVELGIPKEANVIGTIGTVCPSKGTDYFLQAAQFVFKEHPNTYFIVIGKIRKKYTNFANNIKEQLRNNKLLEHFFLMGERFDIPSLLSAMDIFVQPSLSEAFSIVNMEAMAAGLPVIASRTGGNIEQIIDGETGILVNGKNSRAFADAISNLLSDYKKRRELGWSAVKKAEHSFDIQKNTTVFRKIIERLI